MVSAAVREAARFDRDLVSVRAGLLAAIPVVAVLGGGLAANDPVAGVTMGAGAMLVGIAWRSGGGRPPLALMATDAVVMGAATFVGSVTGSLPVAAFRRPVPGGDARRGCSSCSATAARSSERRRSSRWSCSGASASRPRRRSGLPALVFAGGCAQVLFVALARWPSPLRTQRDGDRRRPIAPCRRSPRHRPPPPRCPPARRSTRPRRRSRRRTCSAIRRS